MREAILPVPPSRRILPFTSFHIFHNDVSSRRTARSFHLWIYPSPDPEKGFPKRRVCSQAA
jgi:hypothetical protein